MTATEYFDEDNSEYLTVLSVCTIKKTRKPWRCNVCGKIFPAGTSKRESYGVSNGEFYTFRSCINIKGISCTLEEDRGDYDQ